jgi:hypothetical protein
MEPTWQNTLHEYSQLSIDAVLGQIPSSGVPVQSGFAEQVNFIEPNEHHFASVVQKESRQVCDDVHCRNARQDY